MITILLTGIIAFLGVIGGYALARIAPEELAPARFYLRTFQLITGMIIAGILLYLLQGNFNPIIIVLFLAGLGLGFFFNVPYLYLGSAYVLSAIASSHILLLVASLIFIFGLFYGTRYLKHINNIFMITLALFFIPFILLFFLKGNVTIINYIT